MWPNCVREVRSEVRREFLMWMPVVRRSAWICLSWLRFGEEHFRREVKVPFKPCFLYRDVIGCEKKGW